MALRAIFRDFIPPRSYERETVREQIARKSGHPSPIGFRTPDGAWSRVWLGFGAQCISDKWRGGKDWIVGDDRHWHLNIPAAAAKRAGIDSHRKSWPQPKGLNIQVYLEAEAPAIGCGWRVVLCQLRDKTVVFTTPPTATVTRNVFKNLITCNKRYRKPNQRKPFLPLIAGDPRTVTGLLNSREGRE